MVNLLNSNINNLGANGGLAPGRMTRLASDRLDSKRISPSSNDINSSNLSRPSFFRTNSVGRSIDFLRAKLDYERMRSLGVAAKDLQISTYAKLKKAEKIELEKKTKRNKHYDIYKG
jgi:hypothetical protein